MRPKQPPAAAACWSWKGRRSNQMPSLTDDVIIACCQVPLAVGDVAANKNVLGLAVTDAASRRASIVVLPELANTGYGFNSPLKPSP